MARTVFISYRREPSAVLANLLALELGRRGIRAYLDVQQTGAGQRFPERLEAAIAGQAVFVCLLAGGAVPTLESEWVLREVDIAHGLGKPMIPVFHENFDSETAPRTTPGVVALLEYDGVKFFDQQNAYMGQSIDELAQMIRRVPDGGARGRRTAVLAAVGGLLAVVGLGLALWTLLTPTPPTPSATPPSTSVAATATPNVLTQVPLNGDFTLAALDAWRVGYGQPPLQVDATLTGVAQTHLSELRSRPLAELDNVYRGGDGRSVAQMAADAGYSGTVQAVVEVADAPVTLADALRVLEADATPDALAAFSTVGFANAQALGSGKYYFVLLLGGA